jgi:DNA repair exonuclease SbcCD ATPase subunit
MKEEMMQQLAETAGRLAQAAEALDRVLGKLDAQQEALNAKIDRIVAAVEEQVAGIEGKDEVQDAAALREQVAELEKANTELKAQAARLTRKTLPPIISCLLSKTGEAGEPIDTATLDKTLQALTVEQRIAVKAEMARAGMIG